METKIFGIKAFDTKDKGDIIIVGLFILPFIMSFFGAVFSGDNTYGTDNTYMAPTLQREVPLPRSTPNYVAPISDYTATKDVILANIDPEIRKHISSVNILERDRIQEICRHGSALGCAITNMDGNGKVTTADIFLSNNYDDVCLTFERTLYHEIGHIKEIHEYGYGASRSEYYADNFASQYTSKKC